MSCFNSLFHRLSRLAVKVELIAVGFWATIPFLWYLLIIFLFLLLLFCSVSSTLSSPIPRLSFFLICPILPVAPSLSLSPTVLIGCCLRSLHLFLPRSSFVLLTPSLPISLSLTFSPISSPFWTLVVGKRHRGWSMSVAIQSPFGFACWVIPCQDLLVLLFDNWVKGIAVLHCYREGVSNTLQPTACPPSSFFKYKITNLDWGYLSCRSCQGNSYLDRAVIDPLRLIGCGTPKAISNWQRPSAAWLHNCLWKEDHLGVISASSVLSS